MKTATFTLEFATPALTAGASLKGSDSRAEIRAPSIRGQLRWWYRALGGSPQEEARLFGSVAGEQGQASTIILRITKIWDATSNPPEALPINHEFKKVVRAGDIGCADMNRSGYLAFNIRAREDCRAIISERTRFEVNISAPRMSLGDFQTIGQVFRMFAMFGAIGSRSRRTFGCLRLVEEHGNLPARPASWEQFSQRRIDWRPLPGGPWTLEDLRNEAANWLKSHRNNSDILPKNKRGEVFGHAGKDGPRGEKRRGSPVILRPILVSQGNFSLGLIVPRPTGPLIEDAIA